MLNYDQLFALEEIVKSGQFVLAANKLGLTQSALSQKIKSLEEKLGQPVLLRSNPLQPTELGKKLLGLLKKVSLLEKSVLSELLSKESQSEWTSIPLAVNSETLASWFMDAIGEVVQSQRLLLQITIDDQERTIELLKEGQVLGCITSVKTAPNGCRSYHLGKMNYVLVCGPQFYEKYFKVGITKKSLAAAPAAIYGSHDRLHDQALIRLFPSFKIETPPYHHIPSPEGLLAMAKKNMAYSLLPIIAVKDLLKTGELIRLMDTRTYSLDLFWQVWSYDEPRLNLLNREILKMKDQI